MARLTKACGQCCILKCIVIVLLFLLVIGIEETELESFKEEIRTLKESKLQLETRLNDCNKKMKASAPPDNYEKYRKRLRSNIENFWDYAENIVNSLILRCKRYKILGQFANITYEHKLTLLNDLELMTQADGYEDWRKAEHKSIGEFVQQNIRQLQSPSSCAEVNVLECDSNKFFGGWGCQVHHMAECLSVAIGLQRLFLYNSAGFKYYENGLDSVLEPFSNSCSLNTLNGQQSISWNARLKTTDYGKVMTLPFTTILSKIRPRLKYLPSGIPKEIASRLLKLEVDPSAWWVGQLAKYIFRYKPEIQQKINEMILKLNFTSPIVGIHIRRTDKVGTEAKAYAVDRYMYHAKQYFDRLNVSGHVKKRRIFLATDDTSIYNGISKNYPEYEVLTNKEGSLKSQNLQSRYSLEALIATIIDVHLLSRCDFFVGTFSSNLGRLVYELMQTERHDAKFRAKSLDYKYFIFGEKERNYTVLMSHKPIRRNELKVEKGVTVRVRTIGSSNGMMSAKSTYRGLVPSYKLEEIPKIVDFNMKT